LFALAVIAVSGTAFAQSTVTLSGGLRVAAERAGTAGAKMALISSDAGSNAFTMTATEDLGGGLKATAMTNVRYSSVTGDNTSGATRDADGFAQNVKLSVAGGFGSVDFGRYTVSGLAAFDPWGTVGAGSVYLGDAGGRYSNVAQYNSPVFNGFKASIAKTMTGATAGNEEMSHISAQYANGPIAVFVGQEENVATTAAQTRGTVFGASYDLGMAKVMLQQAVTKTISTGAKTQDRVSLGATIPMGAITIKVGMMDDKKNTTAATDTSKSAAGVDYALSKRTKLFADYAKTKNQAQSVVSLGIQTTF
jgi:predicted porin